MANFCQVWLTCAVEKEADAIIATLLQIHLVACAKKIPVRADFIWEGSVEHNDEILVIMESREDLFEQIEAEVAKIHSYETFVLQAIPMTKISKKAQDWLTDSLK